MHSQTPLHVGGWLYMMVVDFWWFGEGEGHDMTHGVFFFREVSSYVRTEKASLETRYGKLTTNMDQQCQIWRGGVIAIVNQSKADIMDALKKANHMGALDKIPKLVL
jgi:hypothetical protein